MAKQRITSNKKPLTPEQKKKNLAKQIQEFDTEYMLDYCFNHFMVEQITKQSAQETQNYYRRCYKKLCNYFLEIHKSTPDKTPIQVLQMDILQPAFMQFMKNQDLNVQTINSYLRGYRAFGNWCVKKGYIDFFECPIKEVEPEVKIVYTEEELERLRTKPPYPINKHFTAWRAYIAIGIMLNCGARCNTLLNMKISDIDFDEGYINLNVTKTNKKAHIGLYPEIENDLREWVNWRLHTGAEDGDILLCNEFGEQMARSSFAKAIRVYNERCGVDKSSIHLFRHTFAKMWITSGGDIVTLQQVLTHSELEMVKRYANLYGKDVKKKIVAHSAISQLQAKSNKRGHSLRKK